MTLLAAMRALSVGGVLAIASAFIIAGCAGGSAYGSSNNVCPSGSCGSPSPTPSPSPSIGPLPSPSPSMGPSTCTHALPPAGTEVVGVNLSSTTACNDNVYQRVIGYFGGGSVTQSQVVSIAHSATNNIQFTNLDNQPHTASELGPWSGSYPSNPPPIPATPSPTGMDISVAGFTSGNLDAGKTSPTYVANVPGLYVFGCAYHYLSDNMRTVIIVQ